MKLIKKVFLSLYFSVGIFSLMLSYTAFTREDWDWKLVVIGFVLLFMFSVITINTIQYLVHKELT